MNQKVSKMLIGVLVCLPGFVGGVVFGRANPVNHNANTVIKSSSSLSFKRNATLNLNTYQVTSCSRLSPNEKIYTTLPSTNFQSDGQWFAVVNLEGSYSDSEKRTIASIRQYLQNSDINQVLSGELDNFVNSFLNCSSELSQVTIVKTADRNGSGPFTGESFGESASIKGQSVLVLRNDTSLEVLNELQIAIDDNAIYVLVTPKDDSTSLMIGQACGVGSAVNMDCVSSAIKKLGDSWLLPDDMSVFSAWYHAVK